MFVKGSIEISKTIKGSAHQNNFKTTALDTIFLTTKVDIGTLTMCKQQLQFDDVNTFFNNKSRWLLLK